MKAVQFKGLLQNDHWLTPAYVRLDEQGKIVSISNKKEADISYTTVDGFAVPGIPNAHSHAFQYAMVGITEQHDLTGKRDDFWGWRNAMYQLALSVNPEQMEAIATMLYMEMLRHGYTEVAEFHYVHQPIKGGVYNNKAELGLRLIAAAKTVGIKISLIPIFYQNGGFGQTASPGQRRFLSKDLADYLDLLQASIKACGLYEFATIACGPHSLRAVEPSLIKTFAEHINDAMPFHLHVSEQKKEVEASLAYLGKRPVEWLTENMDLNDNYHLIHATHLTSSETDALAKSGANVVLCPSTEGNLGDGIFSLKAFQKAGGNWSIGTDSQICLNPFADLRLLDYGQRITTHQRNNFVDDTNGDSGLYALNKMVTTGRKAMGKNQAAFFEKGQAFDAIVLDAQTPILAVCAKENLAATIVYASDVSMHLGTMVNGEWVIRKGQHEKGAAIKEGFIKALKELKNR